MAPGPPSRDSAGRAAGPPTAGARPRPHDGTLSWRGAPLVSRNPCAGHGPPRRQGTRAAGGSVQGAEDLDAGAVDQEEIVLRNHLVVAAAVHGGADQREEHPVRVVHYVGEARAAAGPLGKNDLADEPVLLRPEFHALAPP